MTRFQQIAEYERINRAFEKMFFPSVKRAIHSKVKEVINKIDSGGIDSAIRHLHTEFANNQIRIAVERLYRIVGMKHARLNYSRMLSEKGYSPNFQTKGFGLSDQWERFITNYFRRHLIEKITFDIARTTRDALLRVLIVANTEGWGADKTVDKLTDWPYERFQAARIVRTEVNRAANVGATANSESLEYQQVKEWISAEDFRVRGHNKKDHANHVLLDGQKIDAYDRFRDSVNGDLLEFPGDINASAASCINCRCKIAFTAKRDENGDLIPKKRSIVVIQPGQNPNRNTILI